MATPNPFDIPRSVYLGRVLYLCFFPLLTVVVGDFALLGVPQAKEALLAFRDQGLNTQSVCFTLAFLLWMISAWYVARILVGKRFQPDLVGVCRSASFAKGVATQLPRALAALAGTPIAIWLIYNGEERGLGIVLLILAAVVYVGLVLRRPIGERYERGWRKHWTAQAAEQFERFDVVGRGGLVFIGFLFLVSFGILVILPFGMQGPARFLGSPALLLLALMSWTIFGGFFLTYLPKAYGFPAFAWVAAVLLLVSWRLNENHPVAPVEKAAGVQQLQPRPTVQQSFEAWLRARPDKSAPVIFVSSAGGASRAAYWTTATLGLLEDEGHARGGAFADNVFVINSVSGGSLGAAAFVSAVEVTRYATHARDTAPSRMSEATAALQPTPEQPEANQTCTSALALGNDLTGRDHLAAVVGMMLFPDLFVRFFPVRIDKFDRSRALEEVWAQDWQDITSRCNEVPAEVRGRWTQQFVSLPYGKAPDKPDAEWLPALVLDTTAMSAGRPVLQSPFTIARTDVFDLFSPGLATQALTLSQAVHNSARFPYVSPVGVVLMNNREDIWDRLGDGGYVEASATLILSQIIDELIESRLIRDDGTPDCAAGSSGDCFALRPDIKVLVLDNVPATIGSWSCVADETAPAGRREAVRNDVHSEDGRLPLADLTGPPAGALNARGGRGISSELDLLHLARGCGTRNYAELRLPKVLQASRRTRDPSMNWMLNEASRNSMMGALRTASCTRDESTLSHSQQALRLNLSIALSWLTKSAAPPSLQDSQICAATSATAPPGTRQ